jgi:hypothetical protein
MCLGEILNFQSDHAVLFEKVSASGWRIKMYLVEVSKLPVGRLNSTQVVTGIFRPDN